MNAVPPFYAERMGPGFVTADRLLAERLPRSLARLAGRSAVARGLALGWLARRGDGVAVIRGERGSLSALAVCSAPPAKRRIFVLELIRRPIPSSAWRRALYRPWRKLVEGPLLRRGMAGAQVMTDWERDAYAADYQLDPARVHHLPWAFCEHGRGAPPPVRDSGRAVFSGGRSACDWQTLFEAAGGAGWELRVVCSARDLPEVNRLAASTAGAEVRSEVPWAEADGLLRGADVCVIALAERALSSGHVRLMAAVEAGVAVVASDVRSLGGYTLAGRTAVVVQPGDPGALREAVDRLLAEPKRREALRDAALERGRGWTYDDYFARIGKLVGATGDRSAGASASG